MLCVDKQKCYFATQSLYTFFPFFYFSVETARKICHHPRMGLRERDSISQSILTRSNKFKTVKWQLLFADCTAVSAPFPATADHCTLLSVWWQWKNPCVCVGVNMCQPIMPFPSSKGSSTWGFTAHLLVSADLWKSTKNQ